MRGFRCHAFLAAALMIFLTACQTAERQTPAAIAEARRALPSDYRQMIVDRARSEYFDPYSMRDVSISEPVTGTSLLGPTVTVCVRANAKNRMGGYTGHAATAFVFRDGVISTTAAGDHGFIACEGATYQPFPELDSATPAAPPPASRPRAAR